MPTLLTFAALSLIALVAGVSLTRLVPGLAQQHPGILALGLLMTFWAVREFLLRRRVQQRLLAEIEDLAEEVLRLRDQEAVPMVVDVPPEAVAARQPANEPRLSIPDPLRALRRRMMAPCWMPCATH